MTEVAPSQAKDEILEKTAFNNKEDTDGSTIKSNQGSIAENYSDDAESSHDSLDTIATDNKQNEKEVVHRRNRALTVTQNNLLESDNTMVPENIDLTDIHDQIHELEQQNHPSNDSDSDSYHSDVDEKQHKRHESHRSTMSSIHSFASSASNYDLLLARLGSKDSPVSSNQSEQAFESSEINENDDDDEQDEIDWEFWSKVISDFNSVAKSQRKILSFNVQRGIPPSLRGMIWQLFTKSKNIKLEEQYMQLIKEESVYEKAISRDLTKSSLLNHDYFADQEGQEALFNMVKAYSLFDPEVGYSQGLLHVAAPLLLNMPEEEAFCVLVQLLKNYNLRGHFLPQSELLSQRLYQLEGLVGDNLPHVQRHLISNGVRSNLYAQQWFVTVFAFKFPLDTVFRIYDMLFSEGIETLFQFSIALLSKNQSTLLGLEYDDLINFLKNDLLLAYKSNANQLVKDAFQIQIVTKRLDRLAKDFQVESARANNEAEAIETLKRQNKQLSDAIKKMDSDYSELNKEHTEVATELITAKMDIARIHDENEALRQQSNDLKKALETLPSEVETRVKEEMEILYTKNAALVERNSALEDQLAYMENMIIEIKEKFTESENEREGLRQRLTDLKRLMG